MISRVNIDYTNHRGERSVRYILPLRVWFGESEFHPQEGHQWYLRAYDYDKDAERDFAMKDIHKWDPISDW